MAKARSKRATGAIQMTVGKAKPVRPKPSCIGVGRSGRRTLGQESERLLHGFGRR